MDPTIGRIVVYTPTEKEQQQITGVGSTPQKQVPAIIVAVDKKTVNLQVFCDGPDCRYVPNVEEGKKAGQWAWPVIEKSK